MNLQNLINATKHLTVLLLLAQSSPIFAQPPTPPSKLVVMRNADGLLVTDHDRPVLQYQLTSKSQQAKWPRNNYVHPLYNLDGDVITEDFPDDHGHHRGIFWAWHQVSVNDVRLGDSWICQDFQWDVQSSNFTSPQPTTVQLSAHVHWKSPALADANGNAIAVVDEHTTITVHAAAANHRRIDFDIRLKALLPGVQIGGSEDEKGYGGFSPRIKLSPDQTFESPAGKIEPIKNSLNAGAWVNIADKNWGLAILTHPANPGFPQPWILRRSRSMQNAVYPGPNLIPISTASDTHLRYSIIIHRGADHDLNIQDLQDQYVKSAPDNPPTTPAAITE